LSLALGVDLAKKNKKSVSLQEEIIKNALLLVQKELDVNFEIKIEDGVFEINLDKVIEQLSEIESYGNALEVKSDENVIFSKISHFPFMLRDIAVWVQNDNSSDDLLNLIKEKGEDLLVQVKLFDSYASNYGMNNGEFFKYIFESFLKERDLKRKEIDIEIKIKKYNEKIRLLKQEKEENNKRLQIQKELNKNKTNFYEKVIKEMANRICLGWSEGVYKDCFHKSLNFKKSPEEMFSDAMKKSKELKYSQKEKNKLKEQYEEIYN
jgi:hypothetical protein